MTRQKQTRRAKALARFAYRPKEMGEDAKQYEKYCERKRVELASLTGNKQ